MEFFSGLPTAVLAGTAVWVVGLGAAGIWATRLGPWYYALRKPSWKPPDFLFGPVWTTIFLCSGAAFLLAWRSPAATDGARAALVAAWTANAALNVLWSVLFFRRERPDWALREVIVLWCSILAMALVAGRLSATAGWLVVPYLVWVAFAARLNRAIVVLNGPFGA